MSETTRNLTLRDLKASGQISTRCFNAMQSWYGISGRRDIQKREPDIEITENTTLIEIARLPESELLRRTNFGRKCLEEMRAVLKIYGLTFGWQEMTDTPEVLTDISVLLEQRHKLGHSSKYVFTKTPYYCQSCGKKDVWDDNQDDYYVGSTLICFDCGSTWNSAGGVRDCDWFDQIKEQLEKGET